MLPISYVTLSLNNTRKKALGRLEPATQIGGRQVRAVEFNISASTSRSIDVLLHGSM